MKTTQVVGAAALLAAGATALPQDFTKIQYPPGTGENLPSYPAPPGGWENVKYPPGTGANLPSYPPGTGAGAPATVCPDTSKPGSALANMVFTSTYKLEATPDQVVNADNVKTGGLDGTSATYEFGINGAMDLICWNIELRNFRGNYQSPAFTATHIHQADVGKNGPPRIAFPNPVGDGAVRYSKGCMTGPFRTNVTANGKDSGEGFRVSQIEANPANFFADVHSSLAVPGAVRGQLA